MTENNAPQDKPDISMKMSQIPIDPLLPVEPKVRELTPVVFFDRLPPEAEEVVFDFRPLSDEERAAERTQVEEVLAAPKDSSAQVSADFSDVIPEPEPETTVPAEKDSGQPKENASSTPTS